MKKKIFRTFFALLLVLPFSIMFSACGKDKHNFSVDWSSDNEYHWHACTDENCTEVSDKAEHTFGDYQVVTNPTYGVAGLEKRVCEVCGREETRAIDPLPLLVDHTGNIEVFYDGENKCTQALLPTYLDITGFVGDDDITDADEIYLSFDNGTTWEEFSDVVWANHEMVEVGEYNLGYKLVFSNYNTITATNKLIISKRTLTDSTGNIEVVYDGENKCTAELLPTYLDITGFVGDDDITDADEIYLSFDNGSTWERFEDIVWANHEMVEVGEYNLGYKLEFSNYNTITATNKLIISKRTLTDSTGNIELVYNGKNRCTAELLPTYLNITGFVGDDDITDADEIYLSFDNGTTWEKFSDVVWENHIMKDAGEYNLGYRFEFSDYITITATNKLIIAPKALTVNAKNYSVYPNINEATGQYTVSGWVSGEASENKVLLGTPVYDFGGYDKNTANVGDTFVISVSGLTPQSSNYTIPSFGTATLTIKDPSNAVVKFTDANGIVTVNESFPTKSYATGTYLLLKDASFGRATIGSVTLKNLTVVIDLGGHTLTSTNTDLSYGAIMTHPSSTGNVITIKNGTFALSNNCYSAIHITAGNTATLESNLTINTVSDGVVVLGASGKTTILNSSATIVSEGNYGIVGNGSAGPTTINITGGAITATNRGIYHPQSGTITISAGTITAKTAVELRAGTLNISGGTLVSTAETFSETPNGSGTTITGVALAVSQHTADPDITVTITGGSFTGLYAIYVKDLQNETHDNVNVSISGGTTTGSILDVFGDVEDTRN